jgi:hypothetical protein
MTVRAAVRGVTAREKSAETAIAVPAYSAVEESK